MLSAEEGDHCYCTEESVLYSGRCNSSSHSSSQQQGREGVDETGTRVSTFPFDRDNRYPRSAGRVEDVRGVMRRLTVARASAVAA